ncbi:ATP-dependent DNA helicase [Xenorhabdus szentirmaii]|uniref:ATP-dependent DNA helicase YoaA n=1 Tax=Xenorhabdus szentirmaii DSM 16338 TaxID=1427518 RepID=W1IU51_9GAMM|nr:MULTISPECIES: ATP-dependent DNA helicase [Xenorhabdus]MBD2819367.1 ATP-dependent DNA helicase [Xenorhabdus sp. 42]PHM32690.1 ATP-dependent DNA helicase DinG [Xenorhabdus szentirmaii DSM 16338]CDL81954.1 putative ATP-dependent helicase yoaA [Xenorhabdus szentirmaii DSM 16338]
MSDDFAKNGVLAKAIPGFKPRDAQREMSSAITLAIEKQQQLVVEAGTGTGKTYAYLVPALRSGKKVIISTGSKALQDQLYSRDLPTIVDALGFKGNLALLKGRSNYLCLERIEQQSMGSSQLEADMLSEIIKLKHWSTHTENGDISTCHDVAEDSPVWPLATSTNDNCLGSDCPNYQDCFVLKARRKAMEADVIVVNHHLFMADIVVKDTGFGELIPQADVVIFDEAHQIPDIASQYFGQQLSSRQLMDLSRDIIMAYRTDVRDQAQLQKSADRLTQSAQDFRLLLGESSYRGNLRDALQQQQIQRALIRLDDALELCYDVMKLSLGRSAMLDTAFERATVYRNRLKRIINVTVPNYSYWFECHGRHFLLALTPLSVSDKFSEIIHEQSGCWVFTSATLSVNEQLNHFTERLGLKKARTLLLPSPFDYQRQMLLCVPRHLPSPNQNGGAKWLARMLKPLIESNQGRCFFLCTSHQMMRSLAEEFRSSMTLPVLVQGETSKSQLLSKFIASGNALLVATGSFWEGVDVRGDALSCVIIDKLPFTAPDDPLLKARIEDCQLKGGDAFHEVQLPDAVISLKQGVGRLIRDIDDYGVVIICDNRLVVRPYGEVFLNSLPPAPRTRDLSKAIKFLKSRPLQSG